MRATMMWLVLAALCIAGDAAPPAKFVKGCDDRLAPYLHSKIIGQHAALQLMADEICAHVEPFGAPPSKPLIFSLHGPSQVGKSESHRRIAQALYSATPEDHSTVSCMSHKQCPGYLRKAGLRFEKSEWALETKQLKKELEAHARAHPDAVIVFEDFDKVDCNTREFVMNLFRFAGVGNVASSRPVVFFEANTLGADDITQFFVRHKVDTAGGGAVINLQQVSDMLMAKVVRPEWLKSVTDPSCTTTRTQADVNNMLKVPAYFVPFVPLNKDDLSNIYEQYLLDIKDMHRTQGTLRLLWDKSVLGFLSQDPQTVYDSKKFALGAGNAAFTANFYIKNPLKHWVRQHATSSYFWWVRTYKYGDVTMHVRANKIYFTQECAAM